MESTVLIFTYNRLNTLKKLWLSLLSNDNLNKRSIIIFHDGLKSNISSEELTKWEDVKEWLLTLINYPNLQIKFSSNNNGLAKSIFTGVSEILEKEESAIILEDDLVLSKDFLTYMDNAIKVYKARKDIYSVSGFSYFKSNELVQLKSDVFIYPRPSSWGWATWTDRWTHFKLNQYDSLELNNYKQLKLFQMGGVDLPWMLRNQTLGRIDSWAIQWAWFNFKNSAFSVYPVCSKVQNIGFGEGATHTTNLKGIQGEICARMLNLSPNLEIDYNIIHLYQKKFRLGYLTSIKNAFWMRSLCLKVRINGIFNIFKPKLSH